MRGIHAHLLAEHPAGVGLRSSAVPGNGPDEVVVPDCRADRSMQRGVKIQIRLPPVLDVGGPGVEAVGDEIAARDREIRAPRVDRRCRLLEREGRLPLDARMHVGEVHEPKVGRGALRRPGSAARPGGRRTHGTQDDGSQESAPIQFTTDVCSHCHPFFAVGREWLSPRNLPAAPPGAKAFAGLRLRQSYAGTRQAIRALQGVHPYRAPNRAFLPQYRSTPSAASSPPRTSVQRVSGRKRAIRPRLTSLRKGSPVGMCPAAAAA
jgi:hypothetical protein